METEALGGYDVGGRRLVRSSHGIGCGFIVACVILWESSTTFLRSSFLPSFLPEQCGRRPLRLAWLYNLNIGYFDSKNVIFYSTHKWLLGWPHRYISSSLFTGGYGLNVWIYTSASFLAGMSVRSPRKLCIFVIYEYFSGSKYPKNIIFNFENRSTDINMCACTAGWMLQRTVPTHTLATFAFPRDQPCLPRMDRFVDLRTYPQRWEKPRQAKSAIVARCHQWCQPARLLAAVLATHGLIGPAN